MRLKISSVCALSFVALSVATPALAQYGDTPVNVVRNDGFGPDPEPGASPSPSPVAARPREKTSRDYCEDFFNSDARAWAKPEADRQRLCNGGPVLSVFSSEYSRAHDTQEYGSCLIAIKNDFTLEPHLLAYCADREFKYELGSGELYECLAYREGRDHDRARSLKACAGVDRDAHVELKRACESDLRGANLGMDGENVICSTRTGRTAARDYEQKACFSKLSAVTKVPASQWLNTCALSNQRQNILSPAFDQCRDVLKDAKMDSQSFQYCINAPAEVVNAFHDSGYRACVDRGKGAAFGKYFNLEKIDSHVGSASRVLSDCMDHPVPTPSGSARPVLTSKKVRVWTDLHIHSEQQLSFDHGTKLTVGGMSGLSYNPSIDTFVAVSDSKQFNYVFGVKMKMPQRISEPLGVEFVFNELEAPRDQNGIRSAELLDHEDVAVSKDGRLFVSSEITFESDLRNFDQQLMTYSSNFDNRGPVKLPGDFKPKYARQNNVPYGQTPPQTQGLLGNAGLEGIALSPSEKYSLVANEKPLVQDKNPSNVVRLQPIPLQEIDAAAVLAQASPSPSPTPSQAPGHRANHEPPPAPWTGPKALAYTVEKDPGVGVTAMTFADPTTLLVLERGFDSATRKSTIRIFKVKLTLDAAGIPVSAEPKKLLADIDEIKGQFSPGFRALDNFEGMTFGPDLADGTRSLVLISDNNFSLDQRTALIVLSIAKELLL